ncbi:hypothetical protein AWM75_02950 [Aerococcus urinaehominis]|uniref:Gram-positive cocci surface proteins LPxTG domain-containing protein n=1 Tax=Aerococcus urinaehominis TaxID=128944 RepID=A0A0X8FKI9_9LACT|nr:hypothetical protein AWM75_02950 [Aerococcus urinaehominis]
MASVAIAAFLAGQVQTVQAATSDNHEPTADAGHTPAANEQPPAGPATPAEPAVISPLAADAGNQDLPGQPVNTSLPNSAGNEPASSASPAVALYTAPTPDNAPVAGDGANAADSVPLNEAVNTAEPANAAAGDNADTTATTADAQPNYDLDEKQIKDYSESERYRSDQMEDGAGIGKDMRGEDNSGVTPSDKVEKEGFSFTVLNPTSESKDIYEYGIDIRIDKRTGQRTFTNIFVTDTRRGAPVESKRLSALKEGVELLFEDREGQKLSATYQPKAIAEVRAGRQAGFNVIFTREDLTYINNYLNQGLTLVGWRDKYTRKHPNEKLLFPDSSNFGVTFKVNPYPNENDTLGTIQVEGSSSTLNPQNVVQGQEIELEGIGIKNLDKNARKRLVGQVYWPDGEVVQEARVRLDDQGKIFVTLPKGALQEGSRFNKDQKAIQSLNVRFFARPRTLAEFEAIVRENNEFGDTFYTPTGAGTRVINHDGKEVEIDLQGIDRYDHYNFLGEVALGLDDTRFHDAKFNDGIPKGETFGELNPGDAKIIAMENTKDPENPASKTADDYKAMVEEGRVKVEIDKTGIPEGFDVKLLDNAGTQISVSVPKTAKVGDVIAFPVKYTYTNGSTDIHWFHYKVVNPDLAIPNYGVERGYAGQTLTQTPTVKDTDKKKPNRYTLDQNTAIDNKGNIWELSIDEQTGVVAATVPTGVELTGEETITVPVTSHYDNNEVAYTNAYFNALKTVENKVNHTFESDIPFETEVIYDPELETGTKEVVKKGEVGKSQTLFEQTLINGKAQDPKITTSTVKDPVNAVIRVGIKPKQAVVEIPYTTEYTFDPNKKAGEEEVTQTGINGQVTVTSTLNPETGEMTVKQEETRAPQVRKVTLGTKTEGVHTHTQDVPFGVQVKVDKSLKPGEYRVEKEGVSGKITTTWKIENSQVVGEPTTNTTPAEDAVVLVGDKAFTGNITHTTTEETPFKVQIVERDDLPKGTHQVHQQGKAGTIKRTYKQHIENGQPQGDLVEDESLRELTQAQDHIVYVGTKPLEGSTTVETTNKKPFDVKVVYDKTKPIGYIHEEGGIAGEETQSTDVSSTDGNLTTGNTTTTETKPSVTKVITVGTKDYTGEFKYEHKSPVPFETKIEFDPNMKAGTSEITTPGVLGEETTTVTQSFTNGTKGDQVVNKQQTKDPVTQVIKVGSMTEGTHTHTEDIPFDYEVKYDPNIEAGKYEIEVAGEKGTRTTKWTIKNSEIQGNPEVTETQPTKAIIKVGNKDFTGEVTHTDKKEIPFEVEIVENPNLLVGTKNVKQQGEAGEKEVTYTQAIKNGQADGELKTTENQTKAPKKHIIEVGTKPVEGNTHEVNENVNVEIEYVTDENLEKGKVETGDLVPGKVTSKLVNKIVDGKVVTEEVKEVTPAKQIIKVGAKDFTGTVTHEVKEEVPYTVRIVEDATMKPGTSRVETQGKAGSKTTKYSQDVVNGQASGDMKSEVIATTDPTEHVIHVGTAPVENSKNLSEEVPAEVEYVYDATKDKGTVEKGEYTPGKVETKVVNKYDPKTGEITTTEEKVVTPAKQKIIVGTKDFTGTFETVDKNPIPYEVEYKVDPTLEPGKEVVDQEGVLGEESTTTTHTIKNGKVESSTPGETKQTKAPVKKIVRIGAKTDGTYTHKEDVPFEVEVRVNEALAKGEHKVVQQGEKGEKSTTGTIENSKVVGEPKVETTKQAKKHIIEVGNKDFTGEVSHEVTEDLAFEVEIIEDETLDAGTIVVDQPGAKGTKTTKYTQAVKNGQADGELKSKVIQETPAQKRVVRVGKKPGTCPIPEGTETPINKDIPVEIEYVYDNTKDKGFVETGQVTPGKVESKVTAKLVDGKIIATEETLVTPAKQQIVVGTKDPSGYNGNFSHETTSEQAYKTQVIFDDTLEAGKVEEVQAGINGQTKEMVTQAVVNGVPQDKQTATQVITKPQDRIIRVGTKGVTTEKLQETIKELPVEKVVEIIKAVPQEKLVEIINEVVKVVPQESIKELIKEVPVTRIVEIVREVPVEVVKEIVKEVPADTKVVEIIKEVPVEVIKEVVKEIPADTKVVEVIKEIIKEVPVETIKEVPGIQVRYNKDLKPGEVKVVDPGEKRVTETRDGKTTVITEGRDMIVEVNCGKCETPDKPGKDEPGKDEPGENKPGKDEPGKDTPGENKPGEDKPGEDKPGKDTPGEDKPGKDTPGEDKPGENTPGEDKPGKDEPGKDTPGKDKPGKDTPGENTPGEDKPGKDKPGEDKPGDKTPEKPLQPGQPDKPNQPETGDAEKPNQPDHLVPGQDKLPQTEDAETGHDKSPQQRQTTDRPENHPADGQNQLPATGATASTSLLAFTLAGLGSVFALKGRRKED